MHKIASQIVVFLSYMMSSRLTFGHAKGNDVFFFELVLLVFLCLYSGDVIRSVLTEVYSLCTIGLQLVLLVSMVTSARRSVNVNFLTWIKNVITEMESVTVSPDSPVNTVIKVCCIYYSQIKSYFLTN